MTEGGYQIEGMVFLVDLFLAWPPWGRLITGPSYVSSVANYLFFCLMAAWLNEVVVRAVALLSALTKEYNMHIIQC